MLVQLFHLGESRKQGSYPVENIFNVYILYASMHYNYSTKYYRAGGYFQGFKFLWFGKLGQFCGLLFSWHVVAFLVYKI